MRWLVLLYPARWRRRYEEEFRAFLEQEGTLSLAQRIDLVRGLLDAHRTALRDRIRHAGAIRHGRAPQPVCVGNAVLLTASENGGLLMRRQLLAALFLLLGLGLGLTVPFALRMVNTGLSSPLPGYTALIYRSSSMSPDLRYSLTSMDIDNTGRAMPRVVVTLPAKPVVTFEAPLRDHKIIIPHVVRLGHGMVGYRLCPLAHGQTLTLRAWYPVQRKGDELSESTITMDVYGQMPRLVRGYDDRTAVHDAREVVHTTAS